MRWKPIRKPTEADLEKGWMHHRLMLWNSCNGPTNIGMCRPRPLTKSNVKASGRSP